MEINLIYKPAARMRFDKLCEQKNAAMPIVLCKRLVGGKEQEYERQQKAVCDGAQATGKALIQMYANHFKKLHVLMPEGWCTGDDIPSLTTNSTKIAKFRQNVSSRTIRNHIKQLKVLGFITSYKFHGSKFDYEIWLNPAVLFGTPEKAVNLTSEEVFEWEVSSTKNSPLAPNGGIPKASNISTNGTKFPDNNPKEHYWNNDIDIRKVENLSNTETENGNNDSVNHVLTDCQAMETVVGAAGRSKITVDKSSKMWISDPSLWKRVGNDGGVYFGLARNQQEFVQHFWNYAKRLLWSDRVFTPADEFAAMDAIANGVYRKAFVNGMSGKQLSEFHSEQLKALDIAGRYYTKNPSKYPGEPMAKYVAGKGYFDAENEKGFKVAKAYRAKAWIENKKDYGKRILKLAILHLNNHPKGKAPKHLQVKTWREVYDHYELRCKKMGPDVAFEFYRAASALSVFKKPVFQRDEMKAI